MTETQLQSMIISTLHLSGCMTFRLNSGEKGRVKLCPAGTPDLLVLTRGGAVIWMEVKLPGEKPRPNQVAMHKHLREYKQSVVVVESPEQAAAVVKDAE